jgi:hypothetical protein
LKFGGGGLERAGRVSPTDLQPRATQCRVVRGFLHFHSSVLHDACPCWTENGYIFGARIRSVHPTFARSACGREPSRFVARYRKRLRHAVALAVSGGAPGPRFVPRTGNACAIPLGPALPETLGPSRGTRS